jgi:hypothetical protein
MVPNGICGYIYTHGIVKQMRKNSAEVKGPLEPNMHAILRRSEACRHTLIHNQEMKSEMGLREVGYV